MVLSASEEHNAFIVKCHVVKEDRIREFDITAFLGNVRKKRPKERMSYAYRPKYHCDQKVR